MSTNNTSTSVATNSTQIRQTASTRYSPLPHDGDSFRLLRVLPSLRQGSPIRCELYTAFISRKRNKYIAGSYVWGPPEPAMSIVVDGKHFQVRENLFRFLKAFRSRYKTQVIWLDAICINQDDIQERSHQVQEMKRIYSGAKCVYSWLGFDKSMPHTGIFSPQYIFDLYYRCIRDGRQYTRRRHQLKYLWKAEYWSRMWIVQEFLLAQDVHLLLGRDKLPYSKLKEITQCEALFVGWTEVSYSTSMMFTLITYRGVKWRTFEDLFTLFGMLPRSDPLDGVFALFGLLDGTENDLRLTSIADYSLTVWQLLQQILALDILKFPLKFAERYNLDVIKGQRDDYMGGHVGLELMESLPRESSGTDDSRYARTEGSSLEVAMAIRASRAIRNCEASNNNAIEIAMYTSQGRTVTKQSTVSVELSCSNEQPMPFRYLTTCTLVEACDSRCTTSCVSHAINGFSWIFYRTHPLLYVTTPTTWMDVPLLASYAPGNTFQFTHDIEQRLVGMVEAISSKVRMTVNGRFSDHQNRTLYKLETDVETMVLLSTFIRGLETDTGWLGLLDLAMDLIRKPGTEEDATRPK